MTWVVSDGDFDGYGVWFLVEGDSDLKEILAQYFTAHGLDFSELRKFLVENGFTFIDYREANITDTIRKIGGKVYGGL